MSLIEFLKYKVARISKWVDLNAELLMAFLAVVLQVVAVGAAVIITRWYPAMTDVALIAGWLLVAASSIIYSYRRFIKFEDDIPMPEERFTEVDKDGMVSVERARLEEMLVYMSELEDWLEDHGKLGVHQMSSNDIHK